jgi:hypothetical protein
MAEPKMVEIPVRLVINGVARVALYGNETREDAEKKVRELQFAGMTTPSATTTIVVNDAEIELIGEGGDFGFASANPDIPDPDHGGPS